jgi:hypothetical protein
MAIKEMTRAGITTNRNEDVWEYKETLGSQDTYGNTVLIPGGVKNVSVTISFVGGSAGKIQTSTDTIDTLQNGTPVWVDWPEGDVSVNTSDRCAPPSAIRVYQTVAGTSCTMTIRAQ